MDETAIRSRTRRALRPAIVATIIWALFTAAVLYLKQDTIGGLKLNEVGDVLAGFFSPLAFFLFFLATVFQRTELELQREDLKETRQVLADQQAELERTAKENARQTAIMQQQLETAQFNVTYEEHRIRLYYLAKYITDKRYVQFTYWNGQQPHGQPLYAAGTEHRLNTDNVSVDLVFMQLERTIRDVSRFTPDTKVHAIDEFRAAIEYIQKELRHLVTNPRYANNPLVWARISGADLLLVYDTVEAAAKGVGALGDGQ